MFKYKVSIYMKSGNVIYLRCTTIIGIKNHTLKLVNSNCEFYFICADGIEGIILKKWWQRWG